MFIATQLVRLSCMCIPGLKNRFGFYFFAYCSYCRISYCFISFFGHTIECNKNHAIIKCIQSKNRTRFFFSQINWLQNQILISFFPIHRQILINILRTSKMIFDSHRGDRYDLFSITLIKLQKRQRRKGTHTNPPTARTYTVHSIYQRRHIVNKCSLI